MNCERMHVLIYADLDGELSEKEAQLLKNHLQNCKECRQFLQDAKKLRRLEDSCKVVAPDFVSPAIASIQKRKKKKGWLYGATAACFLVLGLAFAAPYLHATFGADSKGTGGIVFGISEESKETSAEFTETGSGNVSKKDSFQKTKYLISREKRDLLLRAIPSDALLSIEKEQCCIWVNAENQAEIQTIFPNFSIPCGKVIFQISS